MKRLLILDNYDSFTYNLVEIVRQLGVSYKVVRNDKITPKEADEFDAFIFSPGPGIPDETGILKQLIVEYAGKKNMLGVCLGHQAIAECFGASLFNLPEVKHGIASDVTIIINDPLFQGIPKSFKIGHYHSWVVDRDSIPEHLEVIAADESGEIMAIRHKTHTIKGVQFHPESVLTEYGFELIKNFISL